jgi:membrane-bound lytic murein transglycosylase A
LELNRFLAAHYQVYRSVGSNGKGRVLFTGYYEPYLEGRLTQGDGFNYPVYSRPTDLTTIDLSLFSPDFKGKRLIGRVRNRQMVPYDDRHQIDYEGSLAGKAKVLAWVKDPIDLFFLQIQGSGKIFVNRENPINVHYHTTNGRPYRSIGKLLLEEGKIPKDRMSMQSIRAYLVQHPEEVKRIFSYNPSYVFFKIEDDGPLGYLGVRLTPGRSLALDRRIFPLAALAFVETQKPLLNGDGRIRQWSELYRFVLNQDTGGAIRGPGRADLFWGDGPYAIVAAGHMQQEGSVYFLVLKPDSI